MPFKNKGVGGYPGVPVRSDSAINELNRAERGNSNIGSAREFLRKVSAIFAQNLSGERFR